MFSHFGWLTHEGDGCSINRFAYDEQGAEQVFMGGRREEFHEVPASSGSLEAPDGGMFSPVQLAFCDSRC